MLPRFGVRRAEYRIPAPERMNAAPRPVQLRPRTDEHLSDPAAPRLTLVDMPVKAEFEWRHALPPNSYPTRPPSAPPRRRHAPRRHRRRLGGRVRARRGEP